LPGVNKAVGGCQLSVASWGWPVGSGQWAVEKSGVGVGIAIGIEIHILQKDDPDSDSDPDPDFPDIRPGSSHKLVIMISMQLVIEKAQPSDHPVLTEIAFAAKTALELSGRLL